MACIAPKPECVKHTRDEVQYERTLWTCCVVFIAGKIFSPIHRPTLNRSDKAQGWIQESLKGGVFDCKCARAQRVKFLTMPPNNWKL